MDLGISAWLQTNVWDRITSPLEEESERHLDAFMQGFEDTGFGRFIQSISDTLGMWAGEVGAFFGRMLEGVGEFLSGMIDEVPSDAVYESLSADNHAIQSLTAKGYSQTFVKGVVEDVNNSIIKDERAWSRVAEYATGGIMGIAQTAAGAVGIDMQPDSSSEHRRQRETVALNTAEIVYRNVYTRALREVGLTDAELTTQTVGSGNGLTFNFAEENTDAQRAASRLAETISGVRNVNGSFQPVLDSNSESTGIYGQFMRHDNAFRMNEIDPAEDLLRPARDTLANQREKLNAQSENFNRLNQLPETLRDALTSQQLNNILVALENGNFSQEELNALAKSDVTSLVAQLNNDEGVDTVLSSQGIDIEYNEDSHSWTFTGGTTLSSGGRSTVAQEIVLPPLPAGSSPSSASPGVGG